MWLAPGKSIYCIWIWFPSVQCPYASWAKQGVDIWEEACTSLLVVPCSKWLLVERKLQLCVKWQSDNFCLNVLSASNQQVFCEFSIRDVKPKICYTGITSAILNTQKVTKTVSSCLYGLYIVILYHSMYFASCSQHKFGTHRFNKSIILLHCRLMYNDIGNINAQIFTLHKEADL